MATTLAKRISALEQEMLELKSMVLTKVDTKTADNAPPKLDGWRTLFGRSKDDPTFDEAVHLGREYRRRQPKC